MTESSATEPLAFAVAGWLAEAEREGRPVPQWMGELRELLRRRPRRRRPRLRAKDEAGRPSVN